MNFNAKTIKTLDLMHTMYGFISVTLFAISAFVIYCLRSGEFFDRDYLSEWFGQYRKPFLLLNYLFNINGVALIFFQLFKDFKTTGNVEITDKEIRIKKLSATKIFKVSEINTIRLKYNGYKSFWKSWSKGNLNYLVIVDQQNNEYSFEFLLRSYQHKRDLIDQLLGFKNQGVNIKLDYSVYIEIYPNDIDFRELEVQKY